MPRRRQLSASPPASAVRGFFVQRISSLIFFHIISHRSITSGCAVVVQDLLGFSSTNNGACNGVCVGKSKHSRMKNVTVPLSAFAERRELKLDAKGEKKMGTSAHILSFFSLDN